MSLKILPIPAVREQTSRIVRACFPALPLSSKCAMRWAPSTAMRTAPTSSRLVGNPLPHRGVWH